MNKLACPTCTTLNDIKQVKMFGICMVCRSQIHINDELVANLQSADDQEQIITNNYIKAIELIPEYYTPHDMIHLEGTINNFKIKFLIDTGAAMSIIPYSMLKDCSLEQLLDRKACGQLVGVGSDRIMGRIHYVDVIIQDKAIPCSFIMCENDKMTPILGMDFLLSHGCLIDTTRKIIRVSGVEMKY